MTETCKATTADDEPCQNEAGDDGYCWLHEPPADEDDELLDDAADADDVADVFQSETDDDTDSDEESADGHVTPGERYETITVQAPNGGHIAGHSFERYGVKQVAATESVKQALRKGKLQKL